MTLSWRTLTKNVRCWNNAKQVTMNLQNVNWTSVECWTQSKNTIDWKHAAWQQPERFPEHIWSYLSDDIDNFQHIDHQKTFQTHRTMSVMFHDHQFTYRASLTWTIASNLFGPKEVTHKCERHMIESSVFQCPCTCIRALARKAINNKLPGWKPSDDAPTLSNQLDSLCRNAMRSEYCHHHISGRKTSLSLKIPNHDSVILSQSPEASLLQPAQKFKKQMPTRSTCPKGRKVFQPKRHSTGKHRKGMAPTVSQMKKTRAMRSKSAPRDKNTLQNLASNAAGGALSQSQLEAAYKL